jgi:predicted alpha/beta-hydrolase family hydrolase
MADPPHCEFLSDGPSAGAPRLVLAHGAGAPMDSKWMNDVAQALGACAINVVRFEFPYMRLRRERGVRRPPDRAPELVAAWKRVISQLSPSSDLFIGGKSMGGRIASMIADEVDVRGLVCLGYPFHPPGKPERLRTAHLSHLRTPTLIVQGTGDPFGTPADVATYVLSAAIRFLWIEDGDHSLAPRRSSGHSPEQAMADMVAAIADFVATLSGRNRPGS